MRIFIFTFFLPIFIFSQKIRRDTVFCDCAKSRKINLKSNVKIGPTISPKGSGEKDEIKEVFQQSKFTFEIKGSKVVNVTIESTPGVEH